VWLRADWSILSLAMFAVYLCCLLISALGPAATQNDAVERAIKYLSREVPAWSRDNHCFSCHNNGDGARALFVARALSFAVPDAALADTTEWLRKPSAWDENKGEAGFSDKRLARIEFGNSLVEAFDAGLVKDAGAVREAAESLLASQDPSGAWTVDTESIVAAPARYGPVLATYMARRVLERSRDARMAAAIKRANEFLLQTPVLNVMNAAAVLMAFAGASDAQGTKRAQEALDFIHNAQAPDGGWGPYPKTPTEVFDTAIAILALADVKNRAGVADQIHRGREYLISMQLDDGGWIETTRPAGFRSYAQHISTCGWATIALLKTREAHPN
jgi:squalene-hopene cyclase-like protein